MPLGAQLASKTKEMMSIVLYLTLMMFFRLSEDKLGRPALYFKPGREGFNAEAGGVKYLVYCVERVALQQDRRFLCMQRFVVSDKM